MQLWLFFYAGSGGDGIANLFERSNNVTPIDKIKNYWRVHRIVDNSIKFFAPAPDQNYCFRSKRPFKLSENQLNPQYLECIDQNLNCVVTSHDVSLNCLKNSDSQDILCKNQVKVYLKSNDFEKIAEMGMKKNLRAAPIHFSEIIDSFDQFDYVLDVDRIKTDWQYVKDFCNQINFELNYDQYLQYQDLLAGNRTFMNDLYNIQEYTSRIENNMTVYELTNMWNKST